MERIKEITPEQHKCGIGLCPSIFESDKGTYIVIGKKVTREMELVKNKCGEDEMYVEIPKEIINDLINK